MWVDVIFNFFSLSNIVSGKKKVGPSLIPSAFNLLLLSFFPPFWAKAKLIFILHEDISHLIATSYDLRVFYPKGFFVDFGFVGYCMKFFLDYGIGNFYAQPAMDEAL